MLRLEVTMVEARRWRSMMTHPGRTFSFYSFLGILATSSSSVWVGVEG